MRRAFTVGAKVSIALLVPAFASAQAAPGSIEIGGGGGRFFGGSFARGSTAVSERGLEADDDILKGFWVGAQLTRAWGVEIAVRRTATRFVMPADGVFASKPAVAGLDVASVEGLALLSFRHGNFLPYVGAGIGVANLDPDTGDPSVRDSNRLSLSAALGARFYATRWVGARIDLRGRATYLGKRRLGEDRGWSDAGRWFRNAELLGGVFLSFGGRR